MKRIIPVLLSLVLCFIFCACGKDASSNTGNKQWTAQFKMNEDGTLYYDGAEQTVIEIPRTFDGKATGFADVVGLYGVSFAYNGSLTEYLEYYEWTLKEKYAVGDFIKNIYCNDYRLEVGVNSYTLGWEYVYVDGEKRQKHYRAKVYDLNGNELEGIANLPELREWLENN